MGEANVQLKLVVLCRKVSILADYPLGSLSKDPLGEDSIALPCFVFDLEFLLFNVLFQVHGLEVQKFFTTFLQKFVLGADLVVQVFFSGLQANDLSVLPL